MNKKILVTGGRGFLGAHLVEKLRSKGYQVITYDIADRQSILNLADLENVVKQVDVVYHLAAQADLTKMTEASGSYNGATLNMQGTNNVAFVCAKHKKWLIYISTVCVYGNQKEHPTTEDSTPNPPELYAYTKLAGELVVKGYGANFPHMSYTIFRIPTMYGEGMRKAMGMYIFMQSAIRKTDIPVHGDGLQTRALTYVGDIADGLVEVLSHENEAHHETFLLSSTYSISALQMARDIKELSESTSEIVLGEQRPNQTFKEEFLCTHAKEKLGWEANTTWEDGLNKTWKWFSGLETY